MGPLTPNCWIVEAPRTPTPLVRAMRISLPTRSDSSSGSRRRTPVTASHAAGPAGRHVLLEATNPVEHVMHPPSGGLLHDRLELLALAEGVEHRCDGPELQRIGAEEHQV